MGARLAHSLRCVAIEMDIAEVVPVEEPSDAIGEWTVKIRDGDWEKRYWLSSHQPALNPETAAKWGGQGIRLSRSLLDS